MPESREEPYARGLHALSVDQSVVQQLLAVQIGRKELGRKVLGRPSRVGPVRPPNATRAER
eukprot:8146804-Alexandrium_andersonii.AAC.1